MSFNNVRFDNIYLLEGRRKSPFFPVQRNIYSHKKVHRIRSTEKGLLDIQQPIGFIVEDDADSLNIIEHLTSVLMTEDWAPLQFEDEPGRIYQAVLNNDMGDFEKFVRTRKGTLQFVAHAVESETKKLNLTATNQTYTIGGQESTPWKSYTRFTVPQSSFTIESNFGKVVLIYDFFAGDVLEIDYDKRDVFLNGKDLAVAVQLESIWFELEPGVMQMKASHVTELTYSERYY